MYLKLMSNRQDCVVGEQVSDDHGTDRLGLEFERRCRRAAATTALRRDIEFVGYHHAWMPGLGVGL